jgi:hypothetical protein
MDGAIRAGHGLILMIPSLWATAWVVVLEHLRHVDAGGDDPDRTPADHEPD